jgi:hypothetical protein
VRGVLERFPDRSLGHLAITNEDPDAVRVWIDRLCGERDPDADRQAEAQGTGRDVDPRQGRAGVALEPAAEAAQTEQLVVADRAGGCIEGVQQRRGVPLGEDQVVVVGVARPGEVVAEILIEQHGHQVCRRHRRGRMARTCGGGGADRVDAQLLRKLAPEFAASES